MKIERFPLGRTEAGKGKEIVIVAFDSGSLREKCSGKQAVQLGTRSYHNSTGVCVEPIYLTNCVSSLFYDFTVFFQVHPSPLWTAVPRSGSPAYQGAKQNY